MAYKLSRASSLISALIFTSAVAFVAMSCGEDKKEEAAATTTLKYADVSAFVNTNCATSGCHSASSLAAGYNMSTRAGIATKAAESVAWIQKGDMPQAGSPQKTTFDADNENAAKLVEWLKAGAPE